MAAWLWNADPNLWTSPQVMMDYIQNPDRYVYWASPERNLRERVSVGECAFIWRTNFQGTGNGLVAIGVVGEAPREYSGSNASDFKFPHLLIYRGWKETDAKSSWKTGIEINWIRSSAPLKTSVRITHQGTLVELDNSKLDAIRAELF